MYKYESEIYVYGKIYNQNGIYLFKVNNKNTRKICRISSKNTLFQIKNGNTRMVSMASL